MSKVDWITWKTDSKEIINPEKSFEIIESKINNYNTHMNRVVHEEIKKEITTGGLDKNSLEIAGSSPINRIANNIIVDIEDVQSTISLLIQNIKKNLEEQKKIEKDQLIESIEEKIEEEKEKLKEYNNIDNNGELIEITNERIKYLTERLNTAKSI